MTGPDDDRLWRAVTEGVAPLKRKRGAPAKAKPAPPQPSPQPPRRARPVQNAPPSTGSTPPPKRSADPPPLVMGRGAGVDKRTVQRLKRGQLDIEARLDLHGLTQSEAHARLDGFLTTAQDRGLRCVLVITGKGRIGEAGGVLRQMVPRWLNAPPNRGRVLSMSQAQPKHGGVGALYLLLKRKKTKG